MAVRRSREEWKIRGNVFDQFTNGVLFKLTGQGLFGELRSALALGKEANIFIATPGRGSERQEHVIVKIYRLENANFKKMLDYLRHDPRYMHTKPSRRAIIFAWCQREYRNLMLAREAIRCPAPLGFKSNVLVMSLIGDATSGEVARQLKDATPEDPKKFSQLILKDVTSLWKAGLVHGDLSAFNILNDNEAPVFIDFSQATPTNAPNGRELLTRDLTNIANHFRKLGVKVDAEKEKAKILGK
jgi:RIO kinase 1